MEQRLGRDELLTNITLFWVTRTIASSFRYYYEVAHSRPVPGPGVKVAVPTAVAHCEKDAPLPGEWAERNVELLRYSEIPGGLFAAWERPDAYAADLQGMLVDLRNAQVEPAGGKTIFGLCAPRIFPCSLSASPSRWP